MKQIQFSIRFAVVTLLFTFLVGAGSCPSVDCDSIAAAVTRAQDIVDTLEAVLLPGASDLARLQRARIALDQAERLLPILCPQGLAGNVEIQLTRSERKQLRALEAELRALE